MQIARDPNVRTIHFTWKAFYVMMCCLLLLSGCAYRDEQRRQKQANPLEFISVVQGAVDLYQQNTGVLPIKNSTMNTPIYEKYAIDFGKLQKSNHLSVIPSNAYESGGIYIYVLVHAETKHEVKLMDLMVLQAVNEIQNQVDTYVQMKQQLPIGIEISDDFAYLDFKALGTSLPAIQSLYNPQLFLNFMIQKSTGHVAIDYAPDISLLIQKQNLANELKTDEDLRERLIKDSVFVPVSSFPYRWENNQPIPISAS